MADCDRCDGDDGLGYTCSYCGGTFCGEHRLPENHGCPGLVASTDDRWFDEKLDTARHRGEVVRAGGTLSSADSTGFSARTLLVVAVVLVVVLGAIGFAIGVI